MATTKELMKQFIVNEIGIDEIAEEFRTKTFPEAKKSAAPVDVTADPVTPGDDDFFWVSLAYHNHQIDDAEYEELGEAARVR